MGDSWVIFCLPARVVFMTQVYICTVVYAVWEIFGPGGHFEPPSYSTFRRLGAQLFMRVSGVLGR